MNIYLISDSHVFRDFCAKYCICSTLFNSTFWILVVGVLLSDLWKHLCSRLSQTSSHWALQFFYFFFNLDSLNCDLKLWVKINNIFLLTISTVFRILIPDILTDASFHELRVLVFLVSLCKDTLSAFKSCSTRGLTFDGIFSVGLLSLPGF